MNGDLASSLSWPSAFTSLLAPAQGLHFIGASVRQSEPAACGGDPDWRRPKSGLIQSMPITTAALGEMLG
jgi:hypothetical protein